MLQVRFRSEHAFDSLGNHENGYEVTFTVDGAQDTALGKKEQETKVTPPFNLNGKRRGRCDDDIVIAYTVEIEFKDPLDQGLAQKKYVDTTRTYHCPSHVDHEVITLREQTAGGWFEVQVDFRVDLTCG